MLFSALIITFAENKQRGALLWAEIIPYEPDAVSTAEGIVTDLLFSAHIASRKPSLCSYCQFKFLQYENLCK